MLVYPCRVSHNAKKVENIKIGDTSVYAIEQLSGRLLVTPQRRDVTLKLGSCHFHRPL